MSRLPLFLASALALSALTTDFALADADCSALDSLHSKNSNTPAKLTFVNKTPESRTIIWIDFDGGQQQYKVLQPGKKWSIKTFLTHPWLVIDGPGNCLGIYLATPGSRTVNLVDFGSGGGE